MISQKVHKHSWWWIEVESCENEQQVDGEEDLHSLPCFQSLFRGVGVCYCAHVSVCECVHRSLFSSIAKNLFPAKSKVGGGCISTSLHYGERWGGGGGGGWRRHICYKTGRNWKTLTHTHTYTHTCTVWHLEKPQCFHKSFLPKKRFTHLQTHHQWNLIRSYNRHTHYAACRWMS